MAATAPLFDAAALRTLEARGRQAVGGDAFELMRRAGQAAWRHALSQWPQAQRFLVACGPGDNGGDGYVFARLARESGREVQVVSLRAHPPRSALARQACSDYLAAGGHLLAFDGALPAADVVVDALFGIGLSRAPDESTGALVEAINAGDAPVLSLDVPSGIHADSGHAPSTAVRAACTLQFIGEHAGLRTGDARDHAGTLALATLDLPESVWHGVAPTALLLSPDALAARLPPRLRNAHKGDHGHVLCVGGDEGMGGAIALCADAALRTGAGLVSVGTRAAHVAPLLARRPECMAVAIDTRRDLEPLLQRARVVAIGPGLGRGMWGRILFELVAADGHPAVFDADALFHLAAAPRRLAADAVITPHPGEAQRLRGDDGSPLHDRFALARALAARYGCSVVLKGAGTLIAAPDRTLRVIDAGNPGMASGGMGDVLTGVVAALCAQGLPAFDAACFGALLHAHAGDMAARGGERGLLASDLMPCLRAAANPSSRP